MANSDPYYQKWSNIAAAIRDDMDADPADLEKHVEHVEPKDRKDVGNHKDRKDRKDHTDHTDHKDRKDHTGHTDRKDIIDPVYGRIDPKDIKAVFGAPISEEEFMAYQASRRGHPVKKILHHTS